MNIQAETVECACGCGQTRRARDDRDKPLRFVQGHNRTIRTAGTARSPYRGSTNHKREHVAIAERALGHALPKGAEVHHVNGDGRDNKPSNLVICQDVSFHRLLHVRARVLRAGGDPNRERICCTCKAMLAFDAFGSNGSKARNKQCRRCHADYQRRYRH